MKIKTLGLFIIILAANMLYAKAATISTVADKGAWCWFADPRALHYKNPSGSINMSWLGYIDVHGNIKATQYDFNKNEKNEVLVRSYFQPDDHNNPTFLVLPDERVLIIYSRHTDEPAFYYRVSKKPGDITDLGEEKKIVTKNNTTYPSPFILSDDPEHFYLCWRGIGWHPTIARFTLPDAEDNVVADWGPFQMVQSSGARPYAKYHSNGKDKIFFTYTTGHPDNEMPNWLYMNVVNINASKSADGKTGIDPQLEDIKGNFLSKISNGKFHVNKTNEYRKKYPITVVEAPQGYRDWVWQITTDKNMNPVIAMVRINDKKDSHEYDYVKWTGSDWRITPLAHAGGHFHASPQTERCYSGGEAIDPANPNEMYLSLPTNGKHGRIYEIWKYKLADNGIVEYKEQMTKDSEKNNIRPYILQDSEGSPLRLAWMNGDYYYWIVKKGYPQGFPTKIMCAMEEFPTMPASNNATINFISDSKPTERTLIDIPGFKYMVNTEYLPVAIVNNKTYVGSNPFISSDNWAENATGTTGDYWPTTGVKYSISFKYDGKNLTILRDGAIDQIIPAPGLSFQRLVKNLQ